MSFFNRFKLYGKYNTTLENNSLTRLIESGFKILSNEIPDSDEYTQRRSDLESRTQQLAETHKKELNTYLAQGFPDLDRPPTGKELTDRLKTQAPFRSGFVKIRERHQLEVSKLNAELKTLVNDEATRKFESERFKNLSPEQRSDRANESARIRYQTEQGKLDRSYRNINHYGRQGERIKEVQKTRYQSDPDIKAKQIKRVQQRRQRPGIKELETAEAGERRRLNKVGLTSDCGCGCNGDLKTHRKNFRAKFWEGFNLPKEGGFKIYIAGINMDAYWSGEDWENCMLNKTGARPKGAPFNPDDSDDPRHGKPGTYSNLGCRCDRCKQAVNDYRKEYNQNKKQPKEPKEKKEKPSSGKTTRTRKFGPVTTYLWDPETNEKVLVTPTESDLPKSYIKPKGKGRRVDAPEPEKAKNRIEMCGSARGYREHNLRGEKHCRKCIAYMDAHPELDAAECGTPEGYQRHIDQGHKPCNACIAAHNGEANV